MSQIMEVYKYLMDNSQYIGEALLALILFLSLVAKLTPSPKDDEAVGKVKAFVDKLLSFIGLKTK